MSLSYSQPGTSAAAFTAITRYNKTSTTQTTNKHIDNDNNNTARN